MKDIARFLLDAAHSGVYAAPISADVLRPGARASGLAWFDLDLAGVASKAGLLTRCETVFSLPPSFGHNWDALADYLQDLSWRPARGYVVLMTNGEEIARASPKELATALEIFAAAATYWLVKDKLFMVLVDPGTHGGHALKTLPA
jgi:hypothetical protein